MKRLKNISAVALGILMTVSTPLATVEASTSSHIRLYINKNEVIGTEHPIIQNGVTYLPVRAVSEALDIDISYDAQTQQVTLTGDKEIIFTVNKNTYTIDGTSYTMNAKPFIMSGKTYLPVRVIATALDCEIYWDGATQSVNLYIDTDPTVLNVGLVTDSGTIDDRSFNQMTYEGIMAYETGNDDSTDITYIKPAGEAEHDYLDAIDDLVDRNTELIFLPGFKFETAAQKAQYKYPGTKFVIIDGYPHNGDYIEDVASNTESIFFSEAEAGFYAGLVSALSSETGKVSFIGGMEIPAVQKFGWGYVAGVAYANQKYGTNVVVSDFIYQGTFNDVVGGQVLADALYNNGSDIIFHAAGGVGVGVINEAKVRRTAGENVWAVGIDVDQYEEGIMEDGTSAILTSAMKRLDTAAFRIIDQVQNDKFNGGQVVTLDSSDGAVGLPANNPNLTDNTIAKYNEVYEEVANGTVVVPTTIEELKAFLNNCNYTTPYGVQY